MNKNKNINKNRDQNINTRVKSNITPEQFVFCDYVYNYFNSLNDSQSGTVYSKRLAMVDIISNTPGISEIFHFTDNHHLDDIVRRYIERRRRKDYKETLNKNIESLNKKGNGAGKIKEFIENLNKSIDEYGCKDDGSNNSLKLLYVYKNCIIRVPDLINNRYLSTNVGFVFSYDTTLIENVYITFIVDFGSHAIVGHIVERETPTSNTIIRLLKQTFPERKQTVKTKSIKSIIDYAKKLSDAATNEISILRNKGDQAEGDSIIILQSDQAKVNTSNDILQFLIATNVAASFVGKNTKFGNQLSESLNNKLKNRVLETRLKSLPETEFKDLDLESQKLLISACIYQMNNSLVRNSIAVPSNITPKNLEFIKKIFPFPKEIIGRPYTLEGQTISAWNRLLESVHKHTLTVKNLQKFPGGFEIVTLVEEASTDVTSLVNKVKYDVTKNKGEMDITKTLERSSKIKNQTNELEKFVEFYEGPNTYEIANLSEEEIKEETKTIEAFKQYIKEENPVPPDLTLKVIKLSMYNAMKLLNDNQMKTYQKVESTDKKIDIVLSKQEQAAKDLKLQKEVLEDQNTKLLEKLEFLEKREIERQKEEETIRVKRQQRIIRKRANLEKGGKVKFSVFFNDISKILEVVKSSHKSRLIIAKYSTGHLLLFAYGIRVSNLKYFTMAQIRNLVQKKTVVLQIIKKRNVEKNRYPYAPSLDDIVKLIRTFMQDLEEIANENRERNPDLGSANSEIWHPTVLSRETLTKTMNLHLKKAGLILKKNITTHSYRRGFAIVIAYVNGIYQASKMLNHTSISTTTKYLPNQLTQKEVKALLNVRHLYKSLEDLPRTGAENKSLEDIEEFADSTLKQEEINSRSRKGFEENETSENLSLNRDEELSEVRHESDSNSDSEDDSELK